VAGVCSVLYSIAAFAAFRSNGPLVLCMELANFADGHPLAEAA
jgi:hypothetical protein